MEAIERSSKIKTSIININKCRKLSLLVGTLIRSNMENNMDLDFNWANNGQVLLDLRH